jgi:hypothetical protein
MKTLTVSLPALCAAALLVLAGCGVVKLPPAHDVAPDIGFKVNGVYVEFDAGNHGPVSRKIAFSGSPVRIEGMPEDENALVSYMFMNGSVVYANPVSVYLDAPFSDIAPRATVRVIVTAEDGMEDDYILDMEAVERNVLEIRMTN